MTPNNHQVITQYLNDPSEENFERVVKEFSPMIYSICYRVLCKADLAEEASQATFLSLIEKKHYLQSGPSMVGWLHRTAYLSSLWLRKQEGVRRKREKKISAKTADHTPEQLMEKSEVQAHVDEAINSLPSKYKDPLLMKFYENKTYKDIGNAFKTTEECVRKRVTRGLAKLNTLLKKRGVDATSTILGAFLTTKLIASNTNTSFLPTSYTTSIITEKSLFSVNNLTITKGVDQMIIFTKLKLGALILSASVLVGASGAAMLKGTEVNPENNKRNIEYTNQHIDHNSKPTQDTADKKVVSVKDDNKKIPYINTVKPSDLAIVAFDKKNRPSVESYKKLEETIHKDEPKYYNLWANKAIAFSKAPIDKKNSLVIILKKFCENLNKTDEIKERKSQKLKSFYADYGNKKTVRNNNGKWVEQLNGGKETISIKDYKSKLNAIYSESTKAFELIRRNQIQEFKRSVNNLFGANNIAGKAVYQWFEESAFIHGSWSRNSNKQTKEQRFYYLGWSAHRHQYKVK
ncbi:MAG: hypothetical protein COA79_22195 [Planctomycetota bacterium]|nr:MAG: hypothetical protein COA79_22195 [Planctomycetota bacterium]